MDTYYISKISDTSADTLLAVGFASYLIDVYRKLYGTAEDILIRDMGVCFAIQLPQPLAHLDRVNLSSITLVMPFDSERQRAKLAKKGDSRQMIAGFDYDQAMEASRVYRKRVAELPKYLQTPDARAREAPELLEIEPPDATYLGHYQTINMMKIAGTFNELALRWGDLTEGQKQRALQILLQLFREPDNDIEAALSAWKSLAKTENIKGSELVTALQIVNPTSGKGANREKASELMVGNQKNFWLLELLKFKGFMEGTAPVVIKESKDRKTYVLQPREIAVDSLQATMRTLRAALWPSSAVKLDILASLRLAQVFVAQYKRLFEQNAILKRWGRGKITNIASGFEVSFYKDLGSAYATMNVSELHLPDWLPRMENSTAVQAAETLLNEHIYLIQHIHTAKGDEGAEEYELLRFYRDFLSGHDLRPFWQFTTAYSGYLISTRHQGRSMPALTLQGLENLVMHEKHNDIPLTEITQNPGFRRIAYAIRRATVDAQYRWTQKGDRTYEVRYGLGQDLMRKVHHRNDFLAALNEFLIQYNAETAREDEKAARAIANERHTSFHTLTGDDRRVRHLRWMVDMKDLDEVMALIDRSQSPELIGSLLVAYGYASDFPAKKEAEPLDASLVSSDGSVLST